MKPLRPLLGLAAAVALAGCVQIPTAPGGGTPGGRPPSGAAPDVRPVVVTGAQLDPLRGVDPGNVVAFAYARGRWHQIPVQVDERFVYDVTVAYRGLNLGRHIEGFVQELGYADPGTLVGPDPDPDLDDDDEVALMLADFGDEGVGHPEGVAVGTGTEVATTAGGATRYAYLYRRSNVHLDPAAEDLVHYDAVFRRGPYLRTYDREGRRTPRNPRPVHDPYVSNPEDTTVRTAYYTLGFADRWMWNRLEIEGGPDILDVDVLGAPVGNCVRSPYTGSLSRGAFLVNRDGPVRGIRRVIGFNSGAMTEMQWTFYQRLADARTTLRVHPLPGATAYLDHSAEAEGMRYRSSNSDWVSIDGQHDQIGTAAPEWEMVAGRQGSYVVTYDVEVSGVPRPPIERVYLDDAHPRTPPCLLDGAYYGAHGIALTGELQNTDPSRGRAGHFSVRRRFAFGGDPEVALRQLQEDVRVRTQPVRGGA